MFAPHLVQFVRLLLFKYGGGDNAHWISKNKMATTSIQWELCGTNFRENIANLWVSCYKGNNDRSARVLFVQHPREQGEWLRQSFDCIIRPAPSGAGRTTPSQPGHYSLDIFTRYVIIINTWLMKCSLWYYSNLKWRLVLIIHPKWFHLPPTICVKVLLWYFGDVLIQVAWTLAVRIAFL